MHHHRSKNLPHVFFYRKGPALGIKPLKALPTSRGKDSSSQHSLYHMKALHVNVAFMGGTVVIAAMVLAFVQTLR